MKDYFRYFLLVLLAIPALPLMIYQGKRIRKSVPKLPEAKEPQGISGKGQNPLHLILLGESTIAGVGVATHAEGVAGSMANHLSKSLNQPINWKVFARSGYTAKNVISKYISKIADQKADLIVIGLGGNDAFVFNMPWRWQRSIRELIQKLRANHPDTPIVFMNMPPIKEFPAFTSLIQFIIGNLVEIHGRFLQKEVQQNENVFYNEEVITLKNWLHILPKGLSRSDFFSDGVHPSKITYQTWGREMAKFILDKLPLLAAH